MSSPGTGATMVFIAFAATGIARALVRVKRRTITSKALATLLPSTAEGIRQGGEALRRGDLVAFPTETVYGLGANALNPKACRDIFTTKGRPLTDPLIVHVTSTEWARALLKLTEKQRQVFDVLSKSFWPGPLTIVAKASPDVFAPEAITLLTAGTGMVGVRVPLHKEARALIDSAKVPVAAPSANRFGHVSPTSAQHVVADLGAFPIFVMDSAETCSVGIESTVVGFVNLDSKQCVTLFRRGGISEEQLVQVLKPLSVNIELAPSLIRTKESSKKVAEEEIPQIAPGQLLTHYAPDNVESFLWEEDSNGFELPHSLKDTIVVDFGGSMARFKSKALAYRDLSSKGNVDEACKAVFDVLRWTETVENAKAVLLPNVIQVINQGSALALDDRLYRAASGRRVGKVGSS